MLAGPVLRMPFCVTPRQQLPPPYQVNDPADKREILLSKSSISRGIVCVIKLNGKLPVRSTPPAPHPITTGARFDALYQLRIRRIARALTVELLSGRWVRPKLAC